MNIKKLVVRSYVDDDDDGKLLELDPFRILNFTSSIEHNVENVNQPTAMNTSDANEMNSS